MECGIRVYELWLRNIGFVYPTIILDNENTQVDEDAFDEIKENFGSAGLQQNV